MEQLDFPLLTEPLDSYSLKNSFIAAYPNYLVIGSVQTNTEYVFLANTYIKIPTYYYPDFYEALTNIGKFLIHDQQPETETTSVFETETFSLQWSVENNNVFLKITDHTTNKTQLNIDLVQYYFLVNGFKELYFKPYCLKYYVNYSFYCLSEQKIKTDIQNLKSIIDAVQIIDTLHLNFKKEELLLVSENVIRYKNELLLYITLKNIIPPKPF